MELESAIKVLGAILALSGWTKVYLDHIGNRPKLVGRILGIMKGEFSSDGQHFTSLFVYTYITNARKNEIHILDYELYYKRKWYSRWNRALRAYGFENAENIPSTSTGKESIDFGQFVAKLIYTKGGVVKHGTALHGWAPFMGPKEMHGEDQFKYKIVLLDAFGKKHTIMQSRKNEISIHLVMELAEMTLPKHMYSNTH